MITNSIGFFYIFILENFSTASPEKLLEATYKVVNACLPGWVPELKHTPASLFDGPSAITILIWREGKLQLTRCPSPAFIFSLSLWGDLGVSFLVHLI